METIQLSINNWNTPSLYIDSGHVNICASEIVDMIWDSGQPTDHLLHVAAKEGYFFFCFALHYIFANYQDTIAASTHQCVVFF